MLENQSRSDAAASRWDHSEGSDTGLKVSIKQSCRQGHHGEQVRGLGGPRKPDRSREYVACHKQVLGVLGQPPLRRTQSGLFSMHHQYFL